MDSLDSKWGVPFSSTHSLTHPLTHLNVEAHVFVPFVMRRVQLGDQFASFHARVLSQCAGKSLKGFSKLLDGVLLQTWARLQRETQEVTCLICIGW